MLSGAWALLTSCMPAFTPPCPPGAPVCPSAPSAGGSAAAGRAATTAQQPVAGMGSSAGVAAAVSGTSTGSAQGNLAGGMAPAPLAPGGEALVPCGVANLISTHCSLCHAAPPRFGAPMPLMTRADFLAPSHSDPARKVYDVTSERILASDVTRRMPPASSAALAAPELQQLDAWLKAGTQATAPLCAITDPQAPSAPGSVSAPATPPRVQPIEYDDPELKCYKFVAHAQGDKTQPYSVDTQPDMYKGFSFMPPWQGMMYAKSFKPVIDNAAVIHHWLFFKNMAPDTDGAVSDQIGTHPDGQLMHGWAPGGDPLYLQPDVGEEMPGNVSYMLEAHYNNSGGSVAPDMSGIEVCVTPKKPTHVASVSWLGTDNIAGTRASGTCAPTSRQPIQLINIVPHMHLAGRRMKVTIHRANGMDEVLHDEAFDFQSQVSYPKTQQIMPGDTITTDCTYSEPKMFGRGSHDEMCYAFTMYYPKLALTNGDLIWSTLHGPDTCLQ